MKKVAVMTKNAYLARKIELALEDFGISVAEGTDFDLCFWDVDTLGKAPERTGYITMSRTAECMLSLPFLYSDLYAFLEGGGALLTLDEDNRTCFLRGKRIKLTEIEYSLLSLLVSAGGELVSREEIISSVWKGTADMGVINVYVHYLREKLENGEKIILSSRGGGYAVDRRFLGGAENA